jgi:prophage antirepressor-like protein
MRNELIPFSFEEKEVRVVVIDGIEWWVGRDVCAALGYRDTVNALKRHCRGVAKHHPIVDEMGRTQEARIISEGDVFRLITHCNLPEAVRFEKWLFEKVLPEIRRTGGYGNPCGNPEAVRIMGERLTRLEMAENVNGRLLKDALRTISRYENRNFLTMADKFEILKLHACKYPVSAIQRITKKGRTRIKNFLDGFFALGDEEQERQYFSVWEKEEAAGGKGGGA